ncbi:MAG: hypothetical protein WC254_06535 [Candidatus Woesearchaeota archaeon]|jgi:nicotinamide mononucleotide adenylyltransferase
MYEPKLNPTRGMIIESGQPITYKNIELVEQILKNHDEVIFCIGNAGNSNNKKAVMTAGERVELTDFVLQKKGFDPDRYLIIPIENHPDNYIWASDVRMLTPRWNTFVTRNFLNASIFMKGSNIHKYKIQTIDEQQPEIDYYELISKKSYISSLVPKEALEKMDELGVLDRIEVIYNKKNLEEKRKTIPDTALFLGGFQPFTGSYKEQTGHAGAAKQALSEHSKLVIAVGSGQISEQQKDPLTGGQRVEVIRYVLQSNGVFSGNFSLIPIKNIDSNFTYPAKIVEFCPGFKYIYSGNNYTQKSYPKGYYEVVPLTRTEKTPISASLIRNTAMDVLSKNRTTETGFELGSPSNDALRNARNAISSYMAKENLDICQELGFFDTMDFLSSAIK